jgi:DNA-binding CsgD family transcriptional regulator
MAIQECLDAAVRAGDLTQAGAWEQQLDAFAAGTSVPWVQAAATFGRALALAHEEAADVDEVCALFEASLRHHAAANRPFDRARVQLAYGQFLRRTQRRVDARGHLREALATFEDLQAAPFADRAAEELRATGETARKRDPSTLLTLTPMERKIAELVRQGLTNKDVAAQCWVSPRTVAFHLRNVFAKLAITSRGELARLDLG